MAENGYRVELLYTDAARTESLLAAHDVKKLPHRETFRSSFKLSQLDSGHVRLRVYRRGAAEHGCYSPYYRLARLHTAAVLSYDFGTLPLLDGEWNITGRLTSGEGFDLPLDLLRVRLAIRSGLSSEEPVTVAVAADGDFAFRDRRMFLDPGRRFEVFLTVIDNSGDERARYYRVVEGRQLTDVGIRLVQSFLDVWGGWTERHPAFWTKLQQVGYNPRQAHRGEDTYIKFRRWDILGTHQTAEGVITAGKKGPEGDPDLTWNVRLDPIYNSSEGFQLPNEQNIKKYGVHGLHVEACRSLSRQRLADGLTADPETVSKGQRVYMLGTWLFDDARDLGGLFGSDHEHNELHPLYVMELSMGGFFHFAVFESLAIAEAATDAGLNAAGHWPWGSNQPDEYRKAYSLIDPERCRSELVNAYTQIYDDFRGRQDGKGLSNFYGALAERYVRWGIDFGGPEQNEPVAATHRAWARREIKAGRWSAILYALNDRLDRVDRFLKGAPSQALPPVKGPAPQSFLRCVFASEHAWAAEVTDDQLGEANPRISLNRATARSIAQARQILQTLYGDLLGGIPDAEVRARRFAEAAWSYRSLAAPSAAETEGMTRSELRSFGRTATLDQLTAEMAARVDALWEALTPFLR